MRGRGDLLIRDFYGVSWWCSYDSRWQDVTIVILDQISLAPPYTRDEIKAIDPAVKPEFLDRIRTMVRGLRDTYAVGRRGRNR